MARTGLSQSRPSKMVSHLSRTFTSLLANRSSGLLFRAMSVESFTQPLPAAWTTPKKKGDTIPNVQFMTRTRIESNDENPFDWKPLSTRDLCAGKRVVIFSLPGAFTPTCSSTHVPGYEKHYDDLIKAGKLDAVYCLSVNDAFVMRQWGLKQGLAEDKTVGGLGFSKVQMIPDGACQFTRGMGMSCVWNETERGFGERSWRYSMVVDDMKIEEIFVEQPVVQNSGPDPFEVSDADTMLKYFQGK